MADMSNLLVKDDAATPKEWVFIPITDTPNPLWRANDPTIPLDGQPRLSMSSERLKNGSGYKTTAKLEVPVMETLGASGTSGGYVAPPKVAYTTTCIVTMFADGRSTSQDRANALKMALGVVQGASSVTETGVLNNASAGGTFVASELPAPQLYVALVIPS